MRIQVNGEERECRDTISLRELLAEMQFPLEKIAVERNGRIVPRSEHEGCMLGEHDKLEVVTFVGGG